VNPRLPPRWKSLEYRFRLRGREVACRVTQDDVELRLGDDAQEEMDVTIHGQRAHLTPGVPVKVPLPA
jgi:trehalose/maltose hydrolase-like predicted phosphorylase